MEGAEDTGNWNMSMPQELACCLRGGQANSSMKTPLCAGERRHLAEARRVLESTSTFAKWARRRASATSAS